jgi:hypothetical protein
VEEVSDPVLDRFVEALRRLWWLVAIPAFVLAILFGLRTSSGDYQSSATLLVVDHPGALVAVRFPSTMISDSVSVQEAAGVLSSEQTRDDLSQQLGASISSTVTFFPTPPVVKVSVVSSSKELAGKALALYVARFEKLHADQASAALQQIRDSLAKARSLSTDRIAVLDEQLRPLGPDDRALSDAYRQERSERADDLVDIDAQGAAIDAYQATLAADVRVVEPKASPQAVGGTGIQATFGLVIGALLGTVAVAALALLDRRVRTSADVARAGATGLLAAVDPRSEQFAVVSIAATLANVADNSGDARFQIVPIDGGPIPEWMTTQLDEHLRHLIPSAVLIPTRDLKADTEALLGARETRQAILVARWGKSTLTSLDRGSAALRLAGAEVVGCVLLDVPQRARVFSATG